MALLDKVPGDLNLFIGGMFTLKRRDALQQSNITHVLSVIRLPLDQDLFTPFQHMQVEVDDVEDENLIEHFPATNQFIHEGLEKGGGVLVHCAMGKSRSATVCIAYLIWKYNITPKQALAQLRQARAICEPNEGFMQQLELYHSMCGPDDVDNSPAYQRWLYQRELSLARDVRQAPDAEKIRFEDEQTRAGTGDAAFELRCRKCRRTLATSQYLDAHSAPATGSPQNCAHFFLDPLSWMRSELEQGKLDGRLECPKCSTNVGKYAWQGMSCSCGTWVVPGISLGKSRVDQVTSRSGTGAAAGMGIRRPPGTAGGGSGGGERGNL